MNNIKFLNLFVTVLLIPLGVIEKGEYKKFELSCFLFFYGLVLYVTFGIIVGLTATSDIDAKGMQLGQFTTHMTSLTMTLYYKFSINLVLRLIRKLRENGSKYKEAALEMDRFIGGFVFKVFCGYYGSIFFTVLPIFMGMPNTVEVDEKFSYLIPYWYSCGGNETRIFRRFCWKVENVYELLVSNVIQSVLYTLTLHALVMFLLFYTILTYNVKIHAKLIIQESKRLAEESEKLTVLSLDAETREWFGQWDEKIGKLLDDIVKHQQFVRMFTADVTILVQWMVMINMIGIFISLNMTVFFTLVEKTSDTFLTSKLAGMSSIMIVTFFIYCYNAQIITDLNTSIFDGMLDIPWFRHSMNFRKKYIIALCLNQTPINVKASGMYAVNLRMFQSFMKGIYSVINLMKVKY